MEIKEAPRGIANVLGAIGPGIVLSGAVIGSGELLVTTRIGAQFGYIFLWGVILCCVIKYFVQIELGRYVISTNLTSVPAFNRFPILRVRGTSILNLFFFAMLAMIAPAFGGIFGACAGLLYSLFPFIPSKLWGIILYASVTVILWRGYYKDIEKLVMTLGVYDPDFAKRLLALQDKYMEDAIPVDLQTWQQRPGKERFMENLARFASPLL